MILSVQNLTFSYADHTVLEDVSFDVDRGEFLSLLGPNGVGKSTLFRCMLGTLTGYRGRVLVEGQEIRTLPQSQRARRIAYIPQIHRPTFGYTVLDTVLMGTTRHLSPFASPKQTQMEAALDALDRVGVSALSDRSFAHLSGGEQQLVLIARALDYGNQLRVLQQVRALSREGYTVLLSTHNPQHALTFADRVLALHQGAVAAHGPAREVLTPALIRKLYRVETALADTRGGSVLVPLTEGEK